MNTSILNREFQHPGDGWYQIEAKGEHPNRAAGVVQVIDGEASGAIVKAFNTAAGAGTLRHGSEMLIDHEHFSDDPKQESRAYGWLQELQNREDGIYGRIRWTKTGKEAVDGGDYRFFSTEYAPGDLKVLNRGEKPARVRPMRLDGLSLTNMNNNRGQKPITNRDDLRRGPGGPAAGSETNQNQRTRMKTVATKLGLSADASEEAVLAEVTKIANRAEKAEGELVPIKNRVTLLETENTALLGDQVEALMDAHGIKSEDKVRNRLKPVLLGCKNREERIETLKDFGFEAGTNEDAGERAPAGGGQVRLRNRDTQAPGAAEAGAGADKEKAMAAKIRNRAGELRGATPTRGWDDCWQQASREVAAAK